MNAYPTQKTLVILLWNADGATRHRNELDVLLHDKRVDVALITETHFTSRSYFYIPDYRTYRTDHPDDTAHGGSAILVRTSLTHYLNQTHPTEAIQYTSVSITASHYNLNISSVYCPPSQQVSSQDFLSLFSSLGPHFIAGGDFNAKHPQWGCRASNPRGSVLLNTLSSTSYQVITPDEPTYYPYSCNRLPDILDFFITSRIQHLHPTVSVLPDLSSDHSPVLLIIDINPSLNTPTQSLITGRVDWDHFKRSLDEQTNLNIALKTAEDIDQCIKNLTDTIATSIKDATVTTYKQKMTGLLPLTVRLLITEKRRAKSTWQRTRLPTDKKVYNRLTRKLKDTLREYKQNCFADYTNRLTTNDKSLWKATKRILSYKTIASPLQKSDNSWAKSDQEKADTFSQHLSSLFIPHPDIIDPVHTAQIHSDLNIPLQLSPPPKAFHPSDVQFIINNLPKNKSPGYDLITSSILKQLPKKSVILLTYIYNAVLRTTYFPVFWKFSTIKMFPKPNKPTHLASSYRPISLLPVLGKILEKLLLKRLTKILHSSNILPNHQFGFRSQHSTIQQCHRLVDSISSSLERKQYCSGVFLDEAQAFDRIWHQGLLWKLKDILPHTYYLILKSYLHDRYFQVSQGTSYSPILPLLAGVPQGSILGPLLYTIYTSDLPQHPCTHIATFADDKCIFTICNDPMKASNNLQSHLLLLEPWLRKWRIKINEQKSAHVTFTLRHSNCPPIILNHNLIPQSTTIRYLGLILDRRLTWGPHTKIKRTEVNRRYKLLLRLLDKRSSLSLSNKLLIYNCILKPTWTYGIELWGSTKRTNSYKIQSLQSKILRKITDSPSYVSNYTIHNDLNVPFVQDLAVSRYNRFHISLDNHHNPFIRSLASRHIPDQPPRRLKRQWPRDLLL